MTSSVYDLLTSDVLLCRLTSSLKGGAGPRVRWQKSMRYVSIRQRFPTQTNLFLQYIVQWVNRRYHNDMLEQSTIAPAHAPPTPPFSFGPTCRRDGHLEPIQANF